MPPPLAGDWDVQLDGEGKVRVCFDPNILLIGVQPVELEFWVSEADQIAPQLLEACLQAKGYETVPDVEACELDEGDMIPALGITVDYIQVWERGEVGVWADGFCAITFRDQHHKLNVVRKIT